MGTLLHDKRYAFIKKYINILKFSQLLAFLKRQNDGYVPKKSKGEMNRFVFEEAPDDKYLLMKVVLLMGIAGACRKDEIIKMRVDDLQDIGSVLIVNISNTKTGVQRAFTVTNNTEINFLQYFRKYAELRPPCNHPQFFVNYQMGKCTNQPVGINKIGKIPRQIAEYLKLPHAKEYTGHSFWKTLATLLVDAGADVTTLKRHGGWQSTKVAEGYIENSVANKIEISKKVIQGKRKLETSEA